MTLPATTTIPDLSICSSCGQEAPSVGNTTDDELIAQGMPEPLVRALRAQSEEIQRHMAPPGALGLAPLLDKRRLEYGIINEAFSVQAFSDRIFVYQLPAKSFSATYGGGLIHKSDITIDREQKEAPRGILIGAGLKAMDGLRANGVGLGHIVTFVRMAPWRMQLATVAGKDHKIIMLRAGDLTGSEDLRSQLMKGRGEIFFDEQDNQHKLRDPDGNALEPAEVWDPPEY